MSAGKLAAHFAHVVHEERVAAEEEALALIAQAAEGSARDGLSILDQAIAHADMEGEAKVTAAQVRDMLGLSDRGAVRSEEHTSELQSLMRISYAVFCLQKKKKDKDKEEQENKI